MTRYTNINGIDFETHKTKYANECLNSMLRDGTFKTLYQCYEKPSSAKIAIYNNWIKWANKAPEIIAFGIRSFNCFSFNLNGIVKNLETGEIIGFLNITKTKNELILL